MSSGARRTTPKRRRTDAAVPDGLTPNDLLTMYYTMVLIRTLDERIWLMNRQGKVAIVASCQGHEAAQVGNAWAIRQHASTCAFFPYYRDLGLAVTLGVTPTECLLGFLAKKGERFSGARQFALHGAYLKHGIINLSNVVATQIPQAVGYAMACKMRREDVVVATYFGDGGASQGDCHEGMNFASVQQLPVLFVCENNKYAISVPQKKQMHIENVADRAAGYGMPGIVVDGMDILEVYRKTGEAVRHIRKGEGPVLLEYKVERYMSHTSDDDDRRYRPQGEMAEAKKRDPIVRFQRFLKEAGRLTDEMDQEYRVRARKEVDQATEAAEAAPYPDTDTFYDHVYAPPQK